MPRALVGRGQYAVAHVRIAQGRLQLGLFGLVLVAAALMFGLQLSRSSLFIDEVYSWQASRGSYADMVDALRYSEVTPPLYYVLLNAWMSLTGSEAEAAMRVPSVLAGIGLVAAIYWLGLLVAGRRAALIAGALAALSPIILLYAQQVRAYVFVMLLVTLSVAAVLHWSERERATRWLVFAAVTAVLGVLVHYTAVLVLIPLAVWLMRHPDASWRARAGLAAAIGLPLLALAPLALEQMSRGHHEATDTYASLTTFNALRIVGTPFDGRAGDGMMLFRELGAVVVIQVLALLALADRFRTVRHRGLIIACGLVPLAVVLLGSAGLQPMALTRYSAVAAPFLLVAVAAVAARAHRALGAVIVSLALVASAAGLIAAQRGDGQFPNTRAAVGHVADHWRSGDVVASVGLLGFDGALSYYGERLMPAGLRDVPAFESLVAATDDERVFGAAVDGRRLWFVSDPVLSRVQIRTALSRLNYQAAEVLEYPGSGRIQLIRAEPQR